MTLTQGVGFIIKPAIVLVEIEQREKKSLKGTGIRLQQ